jgi:hypothetical protein
MGFNPYSTLTFVRRVPPFLGNVESWVNFA